MSTFDPKTTTEPYTIHVLSPLGLRYVAATFPGNSFGAQPGFAPFGSELVIDQSLRESNRDRNGVSLFEHTEEEQLAEHGKLRFGFGPTPPAIVAQVAAARRAELLEQRRNLLATSPAGAGRYQAERHFLDTLDAELAALDVESQGAR